MCGGKCEKCKARITLKAELTTKINKLLDEMNGELQMSEFLEKRDEVMKLIDKLEEVAD